MSDRPELELKEAWKRPGPAKAYYDHVRQAPPLRDELIKMLRDTWGNPEHPGLAKFPEVSREDVTLPGMEGNQIPVTRFTPPDAGPGVWVYLHGGAWISPRFWPGYS